MWGARGSGGTAARISDQWTLATDSSSGAERTGCGPFGELPGSANRQADLRPNLRTLGPMILQAFSNASKPPGLKMERRKKRTSGNP